GEVRNQAYLLVPGASVEAYQAKEEWEGFIIRDKDTFVQRFSQANEQDVTLCYQPLTENTCRVVPTFGDVADYDGDITVPTSVTYEGKEYMVTEIGEKTFIRTSINSVVLGGAVTTIGASAFQASSVTSINLGGAVTTIGDDAFYYCGSLTTVTGTDAVTTIGTECFGKSGLTSAYFPALESINKSGFWDCGSLETVEWGSSLTYIGDMAFSYCSDLTSITSRCITPPTLDGNAFSGVTTEDVCLYVPTGRVAAYQAAGDWGKFFVLEQGSPLTPTQFAVDGIYYKTTSATTCKVTSTPKGVDAYTGSITIPATVQNDGTTYKVTDIGVQAFYNTSITSVTLGNNVTTIG
ncbi:MAG: leucine-rich repeat protein, partial [Bacteroidaceae bacterium]|nr:leucine-rich repeat protein [Bacteroidaceae bacterium]